MYKKYIFIVLAIFSGTIASYSSIHGLLVWPVGVSYILFRYLNAKEYKNIWQKIAFIWSFCGITVWLSYFFNYHMLSYHPSVFYSILHPVEGIKFFLSLLGAIVPIGYAATIFGFLLFILYCYIAIKLFLLRKTSIHYLPILLMLFSFLYAVSITIGRCGFGISSAFQSKYTQFIILGLIGMYISFLAYIKETNRFHFKDIFVFGSFAAIIFLQVFVSLPYGLDQGNNMRVSGIKAAYVLLNYDKISDDKIKRILNCDKPDLRELISICKKYKLNIFSNPFKYQEISEKIVISQEPDFVFKGAASSSVVCDFNSDGKVDILWRNKSTGQNVVWFMNGAAYSSYAELLQVADTNWHIVGTGDFKSDGKTDILWRNKTTGQNIVWLIDGVTFSNYAELMQVTDTNWQIVGTGDFNSDGKTDILWRNKSTGQNIVWYMNGATLSSYSWIDTVADTNWEIVGPK